jgi:N-sulfoglucosamine sulfohydrolase
MKKLHLVLILIFSFAFSSMNSLWSQQIKLETKPNFVFILADDCTHWDIACFGSADSKTPNIDKLAEEGIKFNRCYQAAPMCSPTRHNIYTGLFPVKSGAYPNHTMVKEGTRSIVHYLKPLGYRVAQSGKRHINPGSSFPFEYLGKKGNPEFDKVEDFLKEVKSTKDPFALVLCSNEPHTPWNKGDASQFDKNAVSLPPNFVDTPETRESFCNYLAEINYLDGQVGTALALLEKYDFDDNTLVIFASEQGNSFPFAKWTLYEAGVKSALIARLPNKIEAGMESEAIVEYADILPTFIEMAGGEIPGELDGKSLVPLFKNPDQSIKEYSYSLHTTRGISNGSEFYGIRSVVDKNYRYIWNLTPEAMFKNNINNSAKLDAWYQSWVDAAATDKNAEKLILKYKKRPGEELYDIKTDKWCLNNLAEDPDFSDIKKGLRQELLAWMKSCGDEGQKTELEARLHMPKYLRKK